MVCEGKDERSKNAMRARNIYVRYVYIGIKRACICDYTGRARKSENKRNGRWRSSYIISLSCRQGERGKAKTNATADDDRVIYYIIIVSSKSFPVQIFTHLIVERALYSLMYSRSGIPQHALAAGLREFNDFACRWI